MQSDSATRFEDLIVWQKARKFAGSVYRQTNAPAFQQDWGFRDQLRRSAVSIPSNIAEGFERFSKKEYVHFLSIAKGSCAEARTQIILACDFDYVSPESCARLLREGEEVGRLLGGLCKSIVRRDHHTS